MDPFRQQGHVIPEHKVTTADAISRTADETKSETGIQTKLEDFKNSVRFQSNKKTSMSTSYKSSSESEVIIAASHVYNICGSLNSQSSNISSLDTSRDIDLSGGSRGHSVPYDNKILEINETSKTAFDNSALAAIDNKTQTIKQSSSNNQTPVCAKTLLKHGKAISSITTAAEVSQNNNPPSENSDSAVSKKKNIWSVDDMLANPGPSGLNTNDNSKKVCGETSQFWYQSIKRREKTLTCNVCKSEISHHGHKRRKILFYECCICTYNSCEQADLQMHSDTHLPKRFCNICRKEHTEGNLHVGEHTCIVCKKSFHCRTELNEHKLDHSDYFKKHCWVCCRSIGGHFTKEKRQKPYACCSCPFKSRNYKYFRTHFNRHRPKIFCKICKEEYSIEEMVLHNGEYKCVLCNEKFPCKTMLEDHTLCHEYFHTHCRVCNREIVNYHKIENEYICCKCPAVFNIEWDLQSHLCIHTNFLLFKCDLCSKRFPEKERFAAHRQLCPALPYQCKICKVRFPRKDFLDLHSSEKHKKS